MNTKRISAAVVVATILNINISGANASNESEQNPVSSTSIKVDGIVVDTNDPAWDEYQWQRSHGGAPLRYWNEVAKCETRRDWKDHGTFSGGLGIYTKKSFNKRGMGTWERWGGEQFAKRPKGATILQQVVVANRIAMFGWKATYRQWNGKYQRVIQANYYKKPTGFNGWGCIKMYRSGPSKKDRWLNPSKWERNRVEYWRNDTPPYKTHVIKLRSLGVPRYAYGRFPASWLK
jgi:hypothetical protein